jgi:histidine triad (HIT) family protein
MMPDMSACPFCALAAGSDEAIVALRTERTIAFPAPFQRPRNKGHILIVPTGHITRLADADAALLAELYGAAGRICLAVRGAFDATGSMLLQNETIPGQVLHHLHIHVVPRRPDDDFRLSDPNALELSRDERIVQASALRHHLDLAADQR